MVELIDKIPIAPLAIGALMLAFAPFISGPHLVDKIRWLFADVPINPVDWFVLVINGAPLILLLIKIARTVSRR